MYKNSTGLNHGLSHKIPEYGIWKRMRQRCSDPNVREYARYGGRGITMCPEWGSFERFLSDMGRRPTPAHTLDRIDNDGPYGPENCRWTTRREQTRNRANTRILTFQGETLPVAEWAERIGIPYYRLRSRLRLGWTAEQALTTPRFEPDPSKRPRWGSKGDAHWTRQTPDRVRRGETHVEAKLTEDQVRQIRALYRPRELGFRRLAQRFGVSPSLIEQIVKRQAWKHLD